LRYQPTKVVGGEGPLEFIVIERYVARRARHLHRGPVPPTRQTTYASRQI
jgi:hypothetical protein